MTKSSTVPAIANIAIWIEWFVVGSMAKAEISKKKWSDETLGFAEGSKLSYMRILCSVAKLRRSQTLCV